MRNLWLFVYKYRAFFLFFLFEVLSAYLIISYNYFHRSLFINSSNQLVGTIYEKQNKLEEYLQLGTVNDSLVKENVRLRESLKNSYYDGTTMVQSKLDTSHHLQYTYLSAKVINNTTNQRNNFLTLNKGALEGIQKGWGVIGTQGIVGIVRDVSPHFCTVISFLNEDFKASVRLARTKDIGSLVWPGGSIKKGALQQIPNHVELKKGDLVETSGFSLFPEGIPVGKVNTFSVRNGESFYSIDVDIFAAFNSLQYVYIVNNKMATEQKILQTVSDK